MQLLHLCVVLKKDLLYFADIHKIIDIFPQRFHPYKDSIYAAGKHFAKPSSS